MTIWNPEFQFVPAWRHVTAVVILVGWLHLAFVSGFEPWNNLPSLILVQYNHLQARKEMCMNRNALQE